MSAPLPVQVIEQTEAASAALTPLRLSLLKELAEPASAASLAKAVGMPRQKLNYHLKALREAGLVEVVEERQKGNCREIVLRSTARSFVVGPSALGAVGADPAQMQDRFSWGYLLAICARAIRELATLRRGADAEDKHLATLTMEADVTFASAADRSAFAQELAQAFTDIASRYHQPDVEGGRAFRAFVCAHPAAEEPRS